MIAIRVACSRSTWILVVAVSLVLSHAAFAEEKPARPNILWIVNEDMSPHLGCYGDAQAITPNIDKLAAQGAKFTRVFTHAPVCAPSRSGLITGQYPTTLGTHHMRSKRIEPPEMFTNSLRKAGYYVSWPGKTDFNFDVPAGSFDSVNNWSGHAAGQPFFAFINLGMTHESKVRADEKEFAQLTKSLTPAQRHDPAKALLPPYYPDAPEIRRDWARNYDLITAMDVRVGEILADLERQKLAENTVVFYFSDHGDGLPRSKRWVYDSGIRVPLIVRWPKTIEPGSVRDDLVAFIDFAPTVLALANAEIPAAMQGQVFLGPKRAVPRTHIFAARDRMDETFDRIRCVRDTRFKYIRNFHPELPYAQRVSYMEEMPTMKAWRALNAAGKLTGAPALFFAPAKPAEELYDVDADPFEIHNLAADPAHVARLTEMRGTLERWMAEAKDLGAVPETELIQRGLVKDILSTYRNRLVPDGDAAKKQGN